MSKLSLNALKERAGATASTELLATISGGLGGCHIDEDGFDDCAYVGPEVVVIGDRIQ